MDNIVATTVEILGKSYQVKCVEKNTDSLQEAAQFIEKQMLAVRETNHTLTPEKIAVLVALNMKYELVLADKAKQMGWNPVNERLQQLQDKVEKALIKSSHMETLDHV